jgi:hypothetical protein
MVAKRASRWLRRIVPPATAAIFGTMTLQPIGAMPRAKAASAVIWQRISYPPLAVPGTDHEFMSVSVSPNMLVKAEGKDPVLQTPAEGVSVGEPVSLRFALEWGAMDGPSGFPSLPKPIADEVRIHVAMHRGGAVRPPLDPVHWIGIGNGGGTRYSLLAMFDWGRNALDEAWIELQAAGRTYWVELPYGFARSPAGPETADAAVGLPQFPSEMRALTEKDVLVPWVSVRYELGGVTLEMIDACDGRARVTLDRTRSGTATLDSPHIAVEIRRADGQVLAGREIARSIGPRQSVFDFARLFGRNGASRTWDTVIVDIEGARTMFAVPSSLFLLGHRLADFGDRHRIPVPDSNCRD